MPESLFHISDMPDISRFKPRPVASASLTPLTPEGDMVWAVDESHVHNFYVPRDCPRVTFYALRESSPQDIERLMGQSTAKYVVAIEARWFKEVDLYKMGMLTFLVLTLCVMRIFAVKYSPSIKHPG